MIMKTLWIRLPQLSSNYWEPIKNDKFIRATITLLLFFLLFVQSGDWLRSIDAAAAPIDIGILSIFPLLLLTLLLLLGLTLITQEWLWPAFADFRKHHFTQHFNSISPWQQFKVYGFSLCCLLLCTVLVLVALF